MPHKGTELYGICLRDRSNCHRNKLYC